MSPTLPPTLGPEALDLTIASRRLRVYDYGNPSAPPMVLVHGIQDLARSLEPLALAFRDRYHVVAYDLLGHGDSEKPGGYSFPSYVADLYGLIQGLELERPVLVGHSLGGQIAACFAGVFDEVPSHLVTIEGLGPPMREGSFPEGVRKARTRQRIEGILRPRSERRSMPDLETATRVYRSFHPRLDPEVAARLVELGTEPRANGGGLRFKWDPGVLNVWLSTSAQSHEEMWGWVRCPALVVTAERAAEFWSRRRGIELEEAALQRAELVRRVALFPNARHVEIPEASHMVHYDAPEALIAAIDDYLSGS